ncbi:MAG: HD domain-containing protein [Candidatus Hydrogenedentes bacterium]|nr:HD domain-containing protein [Candidatus Hydrogenedentota bacterium]
MKRQYVNTLQEGDAVNDYFVAVRKDLRAQQNGGKFLGMVFKDRTGEVGGILWTNAVDIAQRFNLGDVVSVRGRVATHQGNLQVHVESIYPLREGEYSLEDLVHTPNTDTDACRLRGILDTVKEPFLQRLLQAFWEDAAFMELWNIASAAKRWHHAERGGLIRHCYEMARLAETMCELFPELDRDLLLVAVFAHDIGKLHEMRHDLYVDYTTEGKLLGHLQIGGDMVQEKMRAIPEFPDMLRLQLLHCILSHHGELINGSAIVPKTLEAIVLHHIDNLDAQAAAFQRLVEESREKRREWSEYQPLIGREIWTKGV